MAKHNKQHDARAASFKRIAKEIRVAGANICRGHSKDSVARQLYKAFAAAMDGEAKRLRAMR